MFEYLLRRYDPAPQDIIETLELHHLAHQFRQEQVYREDFEAYCQHYYQLAKQNQQDHTTMQAELNLFSLFCRRP